MFPKWLKVYSNQFHHELLRFIAIAMKVKATMIPKIPNIPAILGDIFSLNMIPSKTTFSV